MWPIKSRPTDKPTNKHTLLFYRYRCCSAVSSVYRLTEHCRWCHVVDVPRDLNTWSLFSHATVVLHYLVLLQKCGHQDSTHVVCLDLDKCRWSRLPELPMSRPASVAVAQGSFLHVCAFARKESVHTLDMSVVAGERTWVPDALPPLPMFFLTIVVINKEIIVFTEWGDAFMLVPSCRMYLRLPEIGGAARMERHYFVWRNTLCALWDSAEFTYSAFLSY